MLVEAYRCTHPILVGFWGKGEGEKGNKKPVLHICGMNSDFSTKLKVDSLRLLFSFGDATRTRSLRAIAPLREIKIIPSISNAKKLLTLTRLVSLSNH